MSAQQIKPEHYQAFRRFLEQSCGIVLGDNKQYLVQSRLGALLADRGLSDVGELVDRMQRASGSGLRGQVIEAMTTNETQWFRDIYPFSILQEQLFPEFQERRVWQVRIWSAACSSGQEPYSVSIALQEFNETGGRLEGQIMATDISPGMINHAKSARYHGAGVTRGLTEDRRRKYFNNVSDDRWEVRPEIRRRVSCQVHNLLESYAALGRFDLILCRNVLIYFSPESRQDILHRMARQLNPGGYLLVGASESLARHTEDFEMIRCKSGVIYRLRDKAGRR